GGTADRNRSHWSTSKTPSYTKSVSWQHHLADVLHGIDATPWAFSPWMVMQATNREARKRLSAFTQLK
ncbi:hypothetical protein ACXYTA_08360, partial [Escherichia coli]